MAVGLALVAGSVGWAALARRNWLSDAETSSAASTPVATSPAQPRHAPFELATVPAAGFPIGWWRITATDGSFTLVGPGPGELEPDHRFWEMDVHGSLDPRCFMYLFELGPVADADRSARARLLSWAERFIAHGDLDAIRLGSAVGWRTEITTRKGKPYGELEVLYANGWEYDIGYRVVNDEGGEATRLGGRFLDSFSAPAIHVGNQS